MCVPRLLRIRWLLLRVPRWLSVGGLRRIRWLLWIPRLLIGRHRELRCVAWLLLPCGILWRRRARGANGRLAHGMLRGGVRAERLRRRWPALITRRLWLCRGRSGPSCLLRRCPSIARLAQPLWQIPIADERASREARRLLGGAVALRRRWWRAIR